MGRVNPLKGIGPEDIGVDKLVNRVLSEDVREVVLATSYTAEGEMTAHMIASVLKKKAPAVRVTRLSKGLSDASACYSLPRTRGGVSLCLSHARSSNYGK